MTHTMWFCVEVKTFLGVWESLGDPKVSRADSEDGAQKIVSDLRKQGDEWTDAEYRIVTEPVDGD